MWCVAAIGVLTGLKLIFEACIGTFAIIFYQYIHQKNKKIIAQEHYLDDDL